MAFVMMIERGKTYNRLNRAAVERHVANIRRLDDEGKLALCGAVKGWKGIAGMIVLDVEQREQAEAICQSEPLVAEGFASYQLYELAVGNRENNYLL